MGLRHNLRLPLRPQWDKASRFELIQLSIPDLKKALYAVNDFKTWMCLICGWIYDEAAGAPEEGLAPGTLWGQVPMNWTCPECGARKEDFEMVQI